MANSPRLLQGLLVATLVLAIAPATSAAGPYAGRPLIQILREFQAEGVNLVFSSAVVRDDWIVEVEPPNGGAREKIVAMLEPFALTLRDGPEGALLVVPAAKPGSRTATESRPVSSFVTEVIVTPSRHTVSRREQGAPFEVTHQDVQTAPSSGVDAGRVVQLLPGVTAADNSSAFRIRGSSTRDSSIILDGLELYDPYHLESLQSPYSLIDGNSIDSIDLHAGGYTADLGDRHGGFVEIATLVPERVAGEIELGSLNSRFTFRAPTPSGRGAWLVSARTWYSDAVFNHTEIGAGENLNPRFQDLYAKSRFAVSPRLALSGHLLLGYDRLQFQETDEDINESTDVETRNANMWFRALSNWSPSLRSESTISAGRIDKRRAGDSSLPDSLLVVNDDRDVDFWGLRSTTFWTIDERQLVKAGVDFKVLRAAYDYSTEDPGDPTSLVRTQFTPSGTSFGAFSAYRRVWNSSFTTEFGVRVDRQTYTRDDHFSPRFNAAWRPDDRSELRLAVGRFKQSQRIHELNVQDGETEFMRAETSEQIEISYQRAFSSGIRVRADAYWRSLSRLRPRYENLFEPVEVYPETALDRIVIAPDKARLRGVELLVRSPPEQAMFWWAGYTLSLAEDLEGGRWIPRSWDQRQTVKFLVGYRAGDRWSVALSGVAHDGWPTTPVTGEIVMLPNGSLDTVLIPGLRNSDRFAGYRRIDAKVRRSFDLRRGKLWLTAEAANLLDTRNQCCVDEFLFENGPPGPTPVAREFDYWLGIRPSFNVLWEF